jgi:DNA repair protein RecO (recombination protein O)
MQQAKIVTSGLVLRETETREADKILTVLTPNLGKISVIARGARRKNSRLAAACQLLVYSEMTLYHRGSWHYLDEASTLELFAGVRQDIELLALASYFAELTESVCGEGEAAPRTLSLLLNALYALSTLKKDPALVKPAFELRLMSLSGFEPLADSCAVCGRPDPEKPMLDVVQGVVHCAACRQKGGLSLPLTEGSLAALRHVLYCPPGRLYSFTLDRPALRQLDHASEGLVAAQLERSFRTLDYYKSVRIEK